VPEILISDRRVGREFAPFLIAEAGINHNGELARALEMVQVATEAGADAIKFQTFKAEEFVGDPHQTYTYVSQGKQVTEPMLTMFHRCELPPEAWFTIKAACDRTGIIFLSTPQNRSDLDLLMQVGVPAVKVGSDDFTNLPLLQSYASTGLPLILSCGMADLAEVYRSLDAVGALDGFPTVLLLCTSQYPTPPFDVNLRKLATLQGAFPSVVIGFSDHTEGPLASSLATALGAAVCEKHFTLANNLEGPDHRFSANPSQLAEWVRAVRTAHLMLGQGVVRPTIAEREMRVIARRSVVALQAIAPGEVFSSENVGIRRPGTGISPDLLDAVLGATAVRHIRAGEAIRFLDIAR
jgi:N,N'-diacetyllegionaminate synthase